MASNPVTTSPDTTPTNVPDPAASPFPTTPPTTPDLVMIPPHQKSFASLPREIRDEIYRLAVPHSCEIRLIFGGKPLPSGSHGILSPQASTPAYANEACEWFFKRNRFRVGVRNLQVMLGEAGISHIRHSFASYIQVIPGGRFNIKPWLRDIAVMISMKDDIDELGGWIGLLLECPALRRVEAVFYRGRSMLKRTIRGISDAFRVLAEKLGQWLMFSLYTKSDDPDDEGEDLERFIGGLEQLETTARDEDSDSEDSDSDSGRVTR